jgi:hypothetical protein
MLLESVNVETSDVKRLDDSKDRVIEELDASNKNVEAKQMYIDQYYKQLQHAELGESFQLPLVDGD